MADIKINVQVVEGQAKAAVAGLGKVAKQTDDSFKALNLTVKGTSIATVAIGNVIANLATKAVSAFGSAVRELIGGGLELEAQIQNLTFKFQALLPATQDAKQFLEEIAALSDQTPFEFEELAEAANKLLVFGVNAEQVKTTLSTLGDISAASGANIVELSEAFGKATEAGVITTRELNLLRNNGIPALQALATELGISTEAVKKLAGEGKIDIKTFESALVSLTKEGGFAFDAMNKKALTLDGSQKTLNDSAETLQRIFGSALAPAVILVRNLFSQLLETISNFLKETNAVETSVMFLVSGFRSVLDVGVVLYNSLNGILFVLNELAAGIAFIVTTSIRGWIMGLGLVVDALASVGSALGLNVEALKSASDSIDQFQQSLTSIPETFHDTATSIADDMTQTSNTATAFATKVEDTYISLVENMKAAAKGTGQAGSDIEKGLTEAQLAEQQKRLEDLIKHNDALLVEQQRKDQILFEQVLLADGELSAQDELELLRQADVLAREREQQQLSDSQKLANKQATELLNEKIKADAAARELAIDKKIIDNKKKVQQQELSDQQAFFSAATSLANSENKTLLAIGKAAALAQLAIKTPEAVASSFAFGARVGGPPLGFVFGAIAATAMAAQAAQITGAKFAEGGIVPGNSFSGDQVSARLNSGEMVLNRQQQSNLFNMANSGGASGGQIIEINNIIELDGEVVGRSVSRQVANGLKLGEVV